MCFLLFFCNSRIGLHVFYSLQRFLTVQVCYAEGQRVCVQSWRRRSLLLCSSWPGWWRDTDVWVMKAGSASLRQSPPSCSRATRTTGTPTRPPRARPTGTLRLVCLKPIRCQKLERWQGPPHINKVKQYRLCCPLRSGCSVYSLKQRVWLFSLSVKIVFLTFLQQNYRLLL